MMFAGSEEQLTPRREFDRCAGGNTIVNHTKEPEEFGRGDEIAV